MVICAWKLNKIIGFFCVVFFLSAGTVFASQTTGTINTTNKYAWASQAGWINFGCTNCGVQITDSAITGYAWSDNYGWINLNPTTSGVANNGEGTLSGYAWSEGLGWINFSGVTINSSGQFAGTATGTNIGTLNFDCANCTVTTDWRPQSSRSQASVGSITLGGGYRYPYSPASLPAASSKQTVQIGGPQPQIQPVKPTNKILNIAALQEIIRKLKAILDFLRAHPNLK